MEFKDLKIGDTVYILENTGTFRKITTYNIGQVASISAPYDDNMSSQYLSQMLRKKLVDITISCDGVQKRLTVGADKTIISDMAIGLTVSTDKQQLINLVDTQYKEYQAKLASVQFYKDEMEKCKQILEKLGNSEQNNTQQIQQDTVDTIKVS